MKHLSLKLLSETVISRRKTMGLSQAAQNRSRSGLPEKRGGRN